MTKCVEWRFYKRAKISPHSCLCFDFNCPFWEILWVGTFDRFERPKQKVCAIRFAVEIFLRVLILFTEITLSFHCRPFISLSSSFFFSSPARVSPLSSVSPVAAVALTTSSASTAPALLMSRRCVLGVDLGGVLRFFPGLHLASLHPVLKCCK